MAQRSSSFDGTESRSADEVIKTDEEVRRVREIICKGTLEQFRALMEVEGPLSKDSEHRLSRRIYLTLYGPITRDASLCWLVSNGTNFALAGHSRGERGISVGIGDRNLALLPEMTLDEIAVKASKIDMDLCRVLKVGQVRAAELPPQHIRVLFSVKGFTQPSIFGKWVDGLTDEMERLGFECVEAPFRTEGEMDFGGEGASQLPSRQPRGLDGKMPNDTQPPESSTQRLRADVLLVAATEVEAEAILDTARERLGAKCESLHGSINTYRDLGEIGGASVLMVRSGKGTSGPHGATLTVADAIHELNPSAVILVGIAFGVDPDEQQIGDVLVSQQITDYTSKRVGTGDEGEMVVILRGDRVSASARPLARFEDGRHGWDEAEVRFGLILSGPDLVDNVEYREELRTFEPEAIGGEMEGAGLYGVAEREKVDWIVVKAICDWADGKKHENKLERQRLAAQNAARFTIHVIEQGGFADNFRDGQIVHSDLAIAEDRLNLDQEKVLQAVYKETRSDPQRGRACMNEAMTQSLGLDRKSYYRIAGELIDRGFLEDKSPPAVNIKYYYLSLTPKGQSYSVSTHSSPSKCSEPERKT